ncbi:MAG: hypothetical protein Kow0042_30240 [Calditrichia bacterium]
MELSEWLKQRTFYSKDFMNPKELAEQKAKNGQVVSLCLPALNEAPTIGKIIKILKKNLYDRTHLLDEIIVIDSGSTDGTQEIARKNGAIVFQASEIMPEMGDIRGKGENLWKSLYVANGDIILWLDTDIRNMHPRFVLGLLGPLLYHPEISFIKGFYRRPIKIGRKLQKTGGGRVTEILVRPFFNLLFPQLALFHQPLAGEYGGRRELLERVPFFTGYGVEAGLLIDIEHRFGMSCMAQCDLKVRIHRNQDLASLRKMAFGIAKVILARAEQQGKLVMLDNMKPDLITVLQNELGEFSIQMNEITELERPPIFRCESYQRKRGLAEDDLLLLEEVLNKKRYPFVSVSPLLDPNLIFLDGEATTKTELFWHMGELLAQAGIVKNIPELVEKLRERENTLSTGIGHGIAIPHELSTNINTMKIVVYRLKNGIPFDSFDGLPVKLCFLVVGPPVRRRYYLQVLANLATLLRDRSVRASLCKTKTPGEFLSLFRKFEVLSRIKRDLEAVES